MNCPKCEVHISSIDEINTIKQTKIGEKNWYKLQDNEPTRCPKCSTRLKLKASKEIKTTMAVFFILTISLLVLTFFYSTAIFLVTSIVIAIISNPLFNYVFTKYGELVENNT